MLKYKISGESVQREPNLFHKGGRRDGRIGRRDKVNSRFSKFCERA